jgi:integrase
MLQRLVQHTERPPLVASGRGRKSHSMKKSALRLVSRTTENRTVVTPLRRPNAELRTREYLTERELESLTIAAKGNRYGYRDATMILTAYRHGFRAAELVDLRWDQIDFARGTPAVRRVKHGSPSTHPIMGDELRALRRQREQEPKSPSVFTSERGSPFTTAGFARLVERAGASAGFGFKAHPHMLRHACGFAPANKGHDTRALQAYLKRFSPDLNLGIPKQVVMMETLCIDSPYGGGERCRRPILVTCGNALSRPWLRAHRGVRRQSVLR